MRSASSSAAGVHVSPSRRSKSNSRGGVAERGGLDRAARVLAQQRLGSCQEISRADPAARELGLELVGAHGILRSKSESWRRPAMIIDTRRTASSRFFRIVSMSALAK